MFYLSPDPKIIPKDASKNFTSMGDHKYDSLQITQESHGEESQNHELLLLFFRQLYEEFYLFFE